MTSDLKHRVVKANQALATSGLVSLTWGNVSAIDHKSGLIAIKPSGVPYQELTIENIVILNLEGVQIEGDLRPSSDTNTHLELYRHFKGIGGIVHTHSPNATAFAQALVELPCLGTTHADHFYGSVPVARPLTPQELSLIHI